MLLKKSARSHGVTTVKEEVSYHHQYACVISHMHLVNLLCLNGTTRDYVEAYCPFPGISFVLGQRTHVEATRLFYLVLGQRTLLNVGATRPSLGSMLT